MEIGIGLDQSLDLSPEDQQRAVREAAALGYTSAWTPSGLDRDAIVTCVLWHVAAPSLVVGTSVVPTPLWTIPTLGALAATAMAVTHGKLVLGIGSGRLVTGSPIGIMREHLVALRERLSASRVPLYLGALGPLMLRLAGELADGAALNWCAKEHVGWSRRRIAEGARRGARAADAVRVVEYVRVAVDDDEDAARRALARASLRYIMNAAYAAHFGRMGLGELGVLGRELAARRGRGASDGELVEALPAAALRRIGYFGRAKGAREGFVDLAAGLDVGIVRVVPVRPGLDGVLTTIRACAR